MLNQEDVDANVAMARALAQQLNEALDLLQQQGVDCLSLVGPPPGWQTLGLVNPLNLTRVSLVLDFKPARQTEPAAG